MRKLKILRAVGLVSVALVVAACRPTALNETNQAGEADFCNVQFPLTMVAVAGQVTDPVFGQLFEAGVTEASGAPTGVTAAVGVGPQGTDPRTAGGWVFTNATYNLQVFSNDEYRATMTAPAAPGTYNYVFRISFDGDKNATYCDANGAGSNAGMTFSTADLGVLVVNS